MRFRYGFGGMLCSVLVLSGCATLPQSAKTGRSLLQPGSQGQEPDKVAEGTPLHPTPTPSSPATAQGKGEGTGVATTLELAQQIRHRHLSSQFG
jgi:hypothetical protein